MSDIVCQVPSQELLIAVSSMSLIGCLYIIASYLYVPALRQHPAGIMFGMSVYGALYQFLFLLENAVNQCVNWSGMVNFVLTGQETYMLIFAIDLVLALKNPFSTSKNQMKTYHIMGCIWSVLFALVSTIDTNYALFGFCWMNQSTLDLSQPINATTTTGGGRVHTNPAGIFFALYILLIYSISLYAILRTWNTLLKGLPDTFNTRIRIHRHLKYYVGCFVFYWTGVLVTYAIYTIFVSYKSPYKCQIWRALDCMLLAKGMVNSIIWTRTSNILRVIQQLREFGYVDLPRHEDSINWALRLEILTNTTKGICESIERAERQAIDGNGTNTQVKYAQVEEILLQGASSSSSAAGRTTATTRTSTNARTNVVFYDYAPHIFRYLRSIAHISSTSYRNSLQQTTKERVSEGKSGAFFYFTEDRKYVVKTLTHEDLKFLLSILPKYCKFMSQNNDTFVTKFLGCHALTMYGKTMFFVVMQSVFDTKLQIHERFDLKGSWVGRLEGRKPTGSLATCKYCNQEYTVGGSHNQKCDERVSNLRHMYDDVGKDLNWNRPMSLSAVMAKKVAKQLVIDSTFLECINCIDYSLLVGIHHRSFNVTPNMMHDVVQHSTTIHEEVNNKPFHQTSFGGMSVVEVHGPGIYFMGLIDILQQWNLRKRIEHFFRVYILFQDRNGISVVKPKQYAERFQQRVIKELIYDLSFSVELHDNTNPLEVPTRLSRSISLERIRCNRNISSETVLSVGTPRSSMGMFPLLQLNIENVNQSKQLSLTSMHDIKEYSSEEEECYHIQTPQDPLENTNSEQNTQKCTNRYSNSSYKYVQTPIPDRNSPSA